MSVRSFQRNFHDGHLASFSVGPRRELTITVALDPVWNKGGSLVASVRFGGIENFDAVTRFLHSLPKPATPGAFIAEVVGLQYLAKGPNWVVLDLAGYGSIEISLRHVAES